MLYESHSVGKYGKADAVLARIISKAPQNDLSFWSAKGKPTTVSTRLPNLQAGHVAAIQHGCNSRNLTTYIVATGGKIKGSSVTTEQARLQLIPNSII